MSDPSEGQTAWRILTRPWISLEGNDSSRWVLAPSCLCLVAAFVFQETWLKERKITKRIYGSVLQGAWKAPLSLKFYAATPLVIRTALFDSRTAGSFRVQGKRKGLDVVLLL